MPLRKYLEDALSLPAAIEARSSALLRAEISRSQNPAEEHVVLVNIGIGIGSARTVQGTVVDASSDGIGSPSHIRYPGFDHPCECGRKGCLEQVASGAAIARTYIGPDYDPMLTHSQLRPYLTKARHKADHGDADAKAIFEQAGHKMAHGIDALHALLSPHRIILSGETGRQADYVKGVRLGLAQLSSRTAMQSLEVSQACGADASTWVARDAFLLSDYLDIQQLAAA